MANTTIVIGNLGQDPELTYTPNGNARVTLSVGDTSNVKNKVTGEWEKGETDWVRCVAWGKEAESIAAALSKGTRVIVLGSYKARKYEDKKTGEQRTARDLQISEIGPTTKYQIIGSIEKQPFQPNNGGGNYGGNQAPQQQQAPQQTQAQPNSGGWSGGFDSEAPF